MVQVLIQESPSGRYVLGHGAVKQLLKSSMLILVFQDLDVDVARHIITGGNRLSLFIMRAQSLFIMRAQISVLISYLRYFFITFLC